MGAGVALAIALQRPEVVRKLVVASVTYNTSGLHPGLIEGLSGLKPEYMVGSPWHDEYMRLAPRPEDFPTLVAKVTQLNMNLPELPPLAVQSIQAPTLLIMGDSDIVRPEHAVEMFRLLGGGVSGDTSARLPASQLAILPGTSHTMVVARSELLLAIIPPFLDAPMPQAD